MRFSYRMVPEVYQVFWAGMARGEFITDAAAEAGTYRKQGTRWLFEVGGVRPRRGRDLKGRCLTFAQREEIALARARGESMRSIAKRLGRSASTVSRELRRKRRCRQRPWGRDPCSPADADPSGYGQADSQPERFSRYVVPDRNRTAEPRRQGEDR